MKNILLILVVFLSLNLLAQYAPKVGDEGTTAIYMDSSIIVSWATGYKDTIYGEDVDNQWKTPEKALGKAQGTSGDIVCLGRYGEITFTFDTVIVNREGPDFVTFENGLSDTFLELGWVEVSKDGITFIRFPNHSLTEDPVDAFGDIDPTKITGYCSKYKQGYGTPFELDSVGLDTIRFVKLIDIAGEGNAYDSDGHVIYDPYKTSGSAGLDIDAIGVINSGNLSLNIEESLSPFTFNIYPNPASDNLQLTIKKEDININLIEIQIINIAGKLVYNSSINKESNKINISFLDNGVYFLRINSSKFTLVRKLIIKH